MFALVDCNNFYCSCERVFRPDLIGKPVLVLSNNDGCVVARSAEVKALGVKMGVPLYQIESLVKQHDIAVFSSNYVLYGDMSNRVMSILSRYAPNLENYSIDESFLDFSGMQLYDLYSYSRSIALTVLKSTGIPVCVGVGQSKTLAKLANYFAKHYKAYKSVCIIDTDDKRNKALKAAPIDEVWGIGRKYAQLLQKKGVVTAYDFVSLSQLWVRNNMSIVGEKVWKELQGVSCLPLESVQTEKKSICTSRSFGKHLTDFEELATAVSEYAALCAAKLRRQKTAAVSVMVFAATNYFRQDLPQYSNSAVIRLPVPSSSSIEIVKYARSALQSIFRKGYQYKRAGVIINDIINAGTVQGNLFDTTDRAKQAKLMKAVDGVNAIFGRHSVELAASGSPISDNIVKRERLSPCYSTRLSDIINVKLI